MISEERKDTIVDQIIKGLIGQGTEGIKPVLKILLNTAMKIEKEQFLGARSHERTEERKGYANGYKPKEFQTRMGVLNTTSLDKQYLLSSEVVFRTLYQGYEGRGFVL